MSSTLCFFLALVLILSFWGVIYFLSRGQVEALPPESPIFRSGFFVFLGFAVLITVPGFIVQLLQLSDFWTDWYDVDFAASLQPKSDHPERGIHLAIASLWAGVLGLPISGMLLFALLRIQVKSDLPSRKPTLVQASLIAFKFIPLTYVVYVVSIFFFRDLLGQKLEIHPLVQFLPKAETREWILFVLQVTLVAGITEEVVFRGLLLGWLDSRSNCNPESSPILRQRITHIGAILFSLLLVEKNLQPAIQAGQVGAIVYASLPVVWALIWLLITEMGPLRRVQKHGAVIACSSMFAAIHANVWPSPIPLFFLGWGLAELRIRTQNVLPCIALHATFNLVSVLYLVFGGDPN